MDVKPQRPRVRVFNDENALPSAQLQKTIHSRHKSQPILKSGLAAAGPQKLGSRKAFGDVSNVNANRTLKDDSAPKGTNTWEKEKIVIHELDEKLSAPLAPLVSKQANVAQIKANIGNAAPRVGSVGTLTNIGKTIAEAVRPQAVRAVRKSKTTVFKEKPEAQEKPSSIQQDLELPRVRAQSLPQPHASTLAAPPAQLSAQDILSDLAEDTNGAPLEAIVEEAPKTCTEYHYTDELAILEEPPATSLLPLDLESYESAHEYLPETINKSDPPMPGVLQEILVPAATLDELERAPLSATTIPEPEEYWDEEDDVCAEEGYVTARSIKSLGDNATSNGTRTLYPYDSPDVRRELAAAKAVVESTRDLEDVEDEQWDTSMVAEYGEEIFEYMRELENRMAPNPHYMDKQTEIQWSMRAVLMDWIVQVHHRFNLLPETLFLTVNLIDRFLSQKVVSLTKLQLVGATAIFVAAKYEEVDCPSIQEVQFMVDNGYKVEEILKAERFMLSMLGFELGFPGPMSFLRRISKADDYDLETRTLAKYFLEVTIMDERFLTCVASYVAAGAHCLARLMLRKGNWSQAHVYYSNYTYAQLLPLIRTIAEVCEDPFTHHAAIYEKYLDKRYKKAASYVRGELLNGFRVPHDNVEMPPAVYATHPYSTEVSYYERPSYLA